MMVLLLGLCIPVLHADEPPPVELRLVSDVARASPGSRVHVLAELEIPQGWHIYWLNPGDSGEATRIELHTDPQLEPGIPQWSAPEERLVLDGGVVNLAYTHQAAALYALDFPNHVSRDIDVQVQVDYLICRHLCAPGSVGAELELPVRSWTRRSRSAARIKSWQERMPRPLPSDLAWVWGPEGVSIRVPDAVQVELFPSEAMEAALRSQELRMDASGVVLELATEPGLEGAWDGSVLRITYTDDRSVDYNIDIPLPSER